MQEGFGTMHLRNIEGTGVNLTTMDLDKINNEQTKQKLFSSLRQTCEDVNLIGYTHQFLYVGRKICNFNYNYDSSYCLYFIDRLSAYNSYRTMSITCYKPHKPNQTKVCSKSLPFSTHYRQCQRQKKKKHLPFCKNLNADTYSNSNKNSLTVDSKTGNSSIFVI